MYKVILFDIYEQYGIINTNDEYLSVSLFNLHFSTLPIDFWVTNSYAFSGYTAKSVQTLFAAFHLQDRQTLV